MQKHNNTHTLRWSEHSDVQPLAHGCPHIITSFSVKGRGGTKREHEAQMGKQSWIRDGINTTAITWL